MEGQTCDYTITCTTSLLCVWTLGTSLYMVTRVLVSRTSDFICTRGCSSVLETVGDASYLQHSRFGCDVKHTRSRNVNTVEGFEYRYLSCHRYSSITYRIRKPSYLVGVEVHPVEGRVEAEVPISLALNLPCAISKYGSSGGRCTNILGVMLLPPSQGGRVYQDVPRRPDDRCQTWSAGRGCRSGICRRQASP